MRHRQNPRVEPKLTAREQHFLNYWHTPVGIAIWIVIILVIAALVKYLLDDSRRK
jgi:hypothetical protein